MPNPTSFPSELSVSEFGYNLPEEKIARYPLSERDASKLLVWKAGKIKDGHYTGLAEFLPVPSLLVFNNSRVVEARLLFQKDSGGLIEIFCLEPHPDYPDIAVAMAQTDKVLWVCLIGGASKWKRGQVLVKQFGDTKLEARFVEKRKDDFIVEFRWTPNFLTFASVMQLLGTIPLPPYLKRSADESDAERYQTLYASASGSVAAPTAGLHFSEKLFQSLSEKGVQSLYLTLHVGAGTFMPVKADKIGEHQMHEEFIEVDATFVQNLISNLHIPVIAVGTTSLRTLESLYWLGLQVWHNKNIKPTDLHLQQDYPYKNTGNISADESLGCLLEWIQRQPEQKLIAKTSLFIVPGYSLKLVRGLITNFHQPHSTLLLLVAALIGSEWKRVYSWALSHDYRFLSYGDGCLLLP